MKCSGDTHKRRVSTSEPLPSTGIWGGSRIAQAAIKCEVTCIYAHNITHLFAFLRPVAVKVSRRLLNPRFCPVLSTSEEEGEEVVGADMMGRRTQRTCPNRRDALFVQNKQTTGARAHCLILFKSCSIIQIYYDHSFVSHEALSFSINIYFHGSLSEMQEKPPGS